MKKEDVLRPQTSTVFDHRNDSGPDFQVGPGHTSSSFQKKGAHDFLRHHLTTQQLFAAQAEHEIQVLTQPFERPADMSAHAAITDAGAAALIYPGRKVPRTLLYPNSESEEEIAITEAQAFVALEILKQLRRWSAARGCRMVLFTHSALWGRSADEKRGIPEHHGALYGICSYAHYKRSLKLLALLGMPLLHVNHEDDRGILTNESRCLAIILPALPRNANVDRSLRLPAASLERILAPGEQLAFEAIAADPGNPEMLDAARSCNPPQSSTGVLEGIGPRSDHLGRLLPDDSLAEIIRARRPSHPHSDETLPDGLTDRIRRNLGLSDRRPGIRTGSNQPESLAHAPDWRLMRAIWNESAHLDRAALYGTQIPALTRQVMALCDLMGTKTFIAAARSWVASIDAPFHFGDGNIPQFSWSFAFLRALARRAHADLINDPSNAPTAQQRHDFQHALRPELNIIGERTAEFELLAITNPIGSNPRVAVLFGNHRAWQLVMHHPFGPALLESAAQSIGAAEFVFAGEREIDLAQTRRLVRTSRAESAHQPFAQSAQLRSSNEEISTIRDFSARLAAAVAEVNEHSPTPLPDFVVTQARGRRFEIDLADSMTDDWFAMRYRRAFTNLIARTFTDELAGKQPEIETVNSAGPRS